jgi:hypothetical protein
VHNDLSILLLAASSVHQPELSQQALPRAIACQGWLPLKQRQQRWQAGRC